LAAGVATNRSGRERIEYLFVGERAEMDSNTIIRVVAGVLFLVVLVIYIQRRRTKVK
jgi:hypothetical protein